MAGPAAGAEQGMEHLAAETAAAVKHHVALSVVGTERILDSGYMQAKTVQETLIKASPVPFSIVHATQFFEFFKSIARAATVGDEVHLSSASIQPMAADVASAVGRVTVGAPLNDTVEVGGPEIFTMTDFIAHGLTAHGDPRTVIADPEARYYGALLTDRELLPSDGAQRACRRSESRRSDRADALSRRSGSPGDPAASPR